MRGFTSYIRAISLAQFNETFPTFSTASCTDGLIICPGRFCALAGLKHLALEYQSGRMMTSEVKKKTTEVIGDGPAIPAI